MTEFLSCKGGKKKLHRDEKFTLIMMTEFFLSCKGKKKKLYRDENISSVTIMCDMFNAYLATWIVINLEVWCKQVNTSP